MRTRLRPALLGLPLAGLMCLGQASLGQAPSVPALPGVPARVLSRLELTGGSADDQSYALSALGLKAGDPVGEEGLLMGLAAVRATDRFRSVEGQLEETPDGQVAHLQLEPWPEVKHRELQGALPKALWARLLPGLHKGTRAGDLRIRRWETQAVLLLKEAGYPQATVRIARKDGGAAVVVTVDPGAPALVRTFTVEGHPAPYGVDRLKEIAGIRAGKSLWTDLLQRTAADRLRTRLIKDKRYEGTAEFSWDAELGQLTLRVEAGPVVRLRQEGTWSFWWKSYEELVPLARAGRYSPELLDEGDRRILRYLRDRGYLDAEVTHRREILRGTAEQPDEVAITFRIDPGTRIHIGGVRFEHNKDLSEAELKKAAGLPSGFWSLGNPPATPELIGTLEDRIKALYWSRGYPDVALRRPPMERAGKSTNLVFQVREGSQQMLDKLVLEMPADPSWQPWWLAETLPLIFTGRLIVEAQPEEQVRVYRGDRKETLDVMGRLEEHTDPARPALRIFTLTTSRPLPFVKNDLAVVFTALRQRMSSLGVQRPLPKLRFDPGESGYTVILEVPDQPRAKVNRFVVQGADYTRADAVLRETGMVPGTPLDAERLARAQTNLANLGAFQRLDLMNLGDGAEDRLPWREGDLLLRAEEQRPWILSSAFGYDKSHGYHIGLGAQRMNFLGMGRTLDFGLRAGDTTLKNPTLRKWFPTGDFNRSVDSFSVGYTDPWFLPGSLVNLLSDRTQFRSEAAYLEETQAAFLAHRRRVLNSLEWKVGEGQAIRLGHRFERTDIKANMEGIELSELFNMAGVPGDHTVISAPFLQVSVDKRDHPIDPKQGTFFSARAELANQLFGTGAAYSFAKIDVRHQWNWSFGEQASRGVLMAAARIGLARPTASSVDDLPLAERFFAGGPFTVRGVEPDFLGPVGDLGIYEQIGGTTVRTGSQMIPLGGQGLVVLNLEYRFPLLGSQTVWGEIFADSGQVYAKLDPGPRKEGDPAPYPHLRTTLGLGVILKLGLPIKFEYAADLKRILGQPRTELERKTQLRGILVSAGFQF